MKSHEGVAAQVKDWTKDELSLSPIHRKWMRTWESFWGTNGKVHPGSYVTKQGASVDVELERDAVVIYYEGSKIAFYGDNELPPEKFSSSEIKALNSLVYYENPLDPAVVKHDLIRTIRARVSYLCNRHTLPSSFKRERLNLSDTNQPSLVNCIVFVGIGDSLLIDEEQRKLLALPIKGNSNHYEEADLSALDNQDLGYILTYFLNTHQITEVRK
ncbi:hypothetical protein EOL71_02690 [Candidatus Saccharibacteria bacterium]|nr:hypothetical protein [Candidatus Saccharibacteria bacterium]